MKKNVDDVFMYYKKMEKVNPNSSILREVKWQYQDMATGGDGGDLGYVEDGEKTCRGINYKGYPDSFFQEVCILMGWNW